MAQFKITVYDANGLPKTGTSAISASSITSGTLALAQGGTHADLSATGGVYQVLKQLSAGADITVGLPGSAALNAFTTFSGAAALTISSISQVFQDLEVTLLIRSGTAAASDTLYVQFGAGSLDTTAANYTSYEILHIGATGSITQSAIENYGSVAQIKVSALGNTAPASGVALIVLRIPRYSSADGNKQIKGQNTGLYQASAGGFWSGTFSGEWRNTSAIQQIKLTLLSGANFATGCAYSVRGLAA